MITTTYTGEVGCLIDSHWGRYMYPRVIGIARDYGMPAKSQDSKYWTSYESCVGQHFPSYEPDSDYMLEWSESAIDWLNENVAADGYAFGWYEGEFFYQSKAWWQKA